jgi:hypothetical protein
MASTLHGNSGIIFKHGGEITSDIYGEESASGVFQIPAGQWDMVPGAGFTHPDAPHLGLERRRVVMNPGIWDVIVDFKGVLLVSEQGPPDQYELNRGSGNDPIERHPDFVSRLAGIPSVPKNGAIFLDGNGDESEDDVYGQFDRFGGNSPLHRVTKYVEMNNITWTRTWVTRTMPTTGGKVKIDTPPGGAPSFDGLTWLYLGLSSTGVRGASCRNRQTWRLGNWNPTIYSNT